MDRWSSFFLLALLFVAADAAPCRNGWTYDPDRGSCYAIPDGAEGNWAEAMAYCAAMSAELSIVESQGEQDFIVNLINKTQAKYVHDKDFWIGAVDILEEGVFIWANRLTELEAYFWGKGQPDNNHNQQGCIRLEHELGWQWGDGDCGSVEYFVCEREAEG